MYYNIYPYIHIFKNNIILSEGSLDIIIYYYNSRNINENPEKTRSESNYGFTIFVHPNTYRVPNVIVYNST